MKRSDGRGVEFTPGYFFHYGSTRGTLDDRRHCIYYQLFGGQEHEAQDDWVLESLYERHCCPIRGDIEWILSGYWTSTRGQQPRTEVIRQQDCTMTASPKKNVAGKNDRIIIDLEFEKNDGNQTRVSMLKKKNL